MNYENGYIVAIAKTKESENELLLEEKNILYIGDTYIFKPIGYKFEPSESAKLFLNNLNSFDVVEFYGDSEFRLLYSETSNDNALVITNKCNSSCIMCPCSEGFRQHDSLETTEHLCKIIDYMPSDVRFLTITGGEPTLIKEDMFKVLSKLKEHFENTKFFFLSNGRTFSNKSYVSEFINNMPERFRFAIPLYGYSEETHDYITQGKGSFTQTIQGIKFLLKNNCEVEIRIVISKLNYTYMEQIADFIVGNLKGVACVNIIATEMCGAAAKNRNLVWIDYYDAFKASEKAVKILMTNAIDVQLYNFPLCKVDRGYWSLCAKSISDYKIRYYETCEDCSVKSLCGGVFRSTLLLTKMKLQPIKGDNNA